MEQERKVYNTRPDGEIGSDEKIIYDMTKLLKLNCYKNLENIAYFKDGGAIYSSNSANSKVLNCNFLHLCRYIQKHLRFIALIR